MRSLAWSNFFSRLTHSHPGRVVWVVFNTLIAFMLMEMNVFQRWAMCWPVLQHRDRLDDGGGADLVINKPLACRRRASSSSAPTCMTSTGGVGAMALASILSITAHLGLFGELAQAFSR